MTDIVERLRDGKTFPYADMTLQQEAADEIERLRDLECAYDQFRSDCNKTIAELEAEIERLRKRIAELEAALLRIEKNVGYTGDSARTVATKALEGNIEALWEPRVAELEAALRDAEKYLRLCKQKYPDIHMPYSILKALKGGDA